MASSNGTPHSVSGQWQQVFGSPTRVVFFYSASLHYANVTVGTLGLSFLVALDTGSDLFWLPCDCVSCIRGIRLGSQEEQKVTVTGNVQLEPLLHTLSKTGKKTSFWEEAAAPAETMTKPAESESKPAEEAASVAAP